MGAQLKEESDFEKIRRSFLASVQDRLEIIEGNLLDMETNSEARNVKERLRNLMAETHSLKGSAAAHDLQFIVTVCHKFEDILVAISGGIQTLDKPMISFLLKFLDLLKSYTANYLSNEKVNELKHRERLQELVPDNLKANSSEASAKNVLVVGLTKSISKQIAVVFDKLSCKVAYATSGYQALGRLLNEHFDVVISNVQMDPIDGITLSSIIKLQKKRMPVQVILLSDDVVHFPFADLKPDIILKKSDKLGEELNQLFMVHKNLVSEEKKTANKNLQRILYVDDDKDVLTLARHSLKKDASLIVSFLGDATKIHEKITEFEPDLLISDIKMPGFNAVQFLKDLRANPETKDLQVLFVSADTESAEAISLLKAGALGVLHKQNMSKDFARSIRKIWEQ